MRNGFNQMSLPYMNELTAGQIGAASVFGGNMPASYINYSLRQIADFFAPQDAPRTGRPEDFEPTIINGRKVLRRRRTQIDDILTPPTFPQTDQPGRAASGPEWRTIELCVDQAGNVVPKGTPGAQCSQMQERDAGIDQAAKQYLGIEGFTSRGLVVLVGVVLLIVAIISLR